MKLAGFEEMDPHLLVGLVNTELRNHAETLEDLAKTHGIDVDRLIERLGGAGYEFRPQQGQFR